MYLFASCTCRRLIDATAHDLPRTKSSLILFTFFFFFFYLLPFPLHRLLLHHLFHLYTHIHTYIHTATSIILLSPFLTHYCNSLLPKTTHTEFILQEWRLPSQSTTWDGQVTIINLPFPKKNTTMFSLSLHNFLNSI